MAEIQLCEHIKDNGHRCGSPARRGHTHCYFHDRLLRRHSIPPDAPCHIPLIRNSRDLGTTIREIFQRVPAGRYTAADLNAIFYGLQGARSVLKLVNEEKRERKRRGRQPREVQPWQEL